MRQHEIFLHHLELQKEKDPLIIIKVASDEVSNYFLEAIKETNGRVQVESLFCALGSVAGFICQISCRASKAAEENPGLILTVKDQAGKTYFIGDGINNLLVNTPTSIWQLALATQRPINSEKLPDIEEIFQHVIKTIGKEEFGIPRYPEHPANDVPINYTKQFGFDVINILRKYKLDGDEWPFVLGVVIQKMLNKVGDSIAVENAITIVMESAVPMSKINLISD